MSKPNNNVFRAFAWFAAIVTTIGAVQSFHDHRWGWAILMSIATYLWIDEVRN